MDGAVTRLKLGSSLEVLCVIHILLLHLYDKSVVRLVLTLLLLLIAAAKLHTQLSVQRFILRKKHYLMFLILVQACAVGSHILVTQTPNEDGYLHGVILLEYVGVRPASPLRLIFMDILVFFLLLALLILNFRPSQTLAEFDVSQMLYEKPIIYEFELWAGFLDCWRDQHEGVGEVDQESVGGG